MKWFEKFTFNKLSDLTVENGGKVYLERWYLIPRNFLFNVYLHRFTHSDLPVPHDHPWFSMSYVLKGFFVEHRPNKPTRKCVENAFYFRTPFSLHWLELGNNSAWTLFFTGPIMKRWGFVEDGKWICAKIFLRNRANGRN